MRLPHSACLLAFGWIGVFIACALVPDRAFSASAQIAAPSVFAPGRVFRVGPARKLKAPSEAAVIVRRGDTVMIGPGGVYFLGPRPENDPSAPNAADH